jgi:hypothetical protein
VKRWEQGRPAVEQMLRERQLQRVTPSRAHADAMLAQAGRYAASAQLVLDSDPDAAYVLAYDAVRAQLDPPLGSTLRPADRMRSRRNRVEYPDASVPPVSAAEVAETLPRVHAILALAEKVVDAMPAWS